MMDTNTSTKKELANEEERMNFANAKSLLNLLDISLFPAQEHENITNMKMEFDSIENPMGLERKSSLDYTARVRQLLDTVNMQGSFGLECKRSLKHLLSWDVHSLNSLEKKASFKELFHNLETSTGSSLLDMNRQRSAAILKDLLGLEDTTVGGSSSAAGNTSFSPSIPPLIPVTVASSDQPSYPETTQTSLSRVNSLDILKMVLSENVLDRKLSFEVLKNNLSKPQNKPMTSTDSFRFQRLAFCLADIEKDVFTGSNIHGQELLAQEQKQSQHHVDEDDESDHEHEHVVQVDNLDHLLDDRPTTSSSSAAPTNIFSSLSHPPTFQPNTAPMSYTPATEIEHQSSIHQHKLLYHHQQAVLQQHHHQQALLQQHHHQQALGQEKQEHHYHHPQPAYDANMIPSFMQPSRYHPYNVHHEPPQVHQEGLHSFRDQLHENHHHPHHPSSSPSTNDDGSDDRTEEVFHKAVTKFCSAPGCSNISRTKGFCKSHGGGRRCKVEGCMKSAQTGHLCISHGGGKPCSIEDCNKKSQSRGLCKQHGGGARCTFDGCNKSVQSSRLCRGHGGGKRCRLPHCNKWAQKDELCAKHHQEHMDGILISDPS